MSNNKKLFIKTWGCQMNVYDSRRITDMLRPLGYIETDVPDEADMMILNTCHIRDKATEKVFSELGRLRELKDARKDAGKHTVIGVAGCVAQAEGDVITRRAPYVDLVFGPQTYGQLPEMILGLNGGARVINTDFPVIPKFDLMVGAAPASSGPTAFLSVQEGCDKFCTFCVVPYTRGAEFSRPVRDVCDEAKKLLDAGAVEITLLGQNVNAYHGAGLDGTVWGLARLIEELAKLPALKRIRYTTSHPRDCDDALIAAHRDIPKLMPFLHLPIQSGSDAILRAMNRKHTVDDYRRIIDRFRDARPDMAFSSDFIVGYPGETDADHAASVALVREIGYASAYSFKYSARPGTPAAALQAALVRDDVASARLLELQDAIFETGRAFNAKFLGQTVEVLVERVTEAKHPQDQNNSLPLSGGGLGWGTNHENEKSTEVTPSAPASQGHLPLSGGGEKLSPLPAGGDKSVVQLHGRTAHNVPCHLTGTLDLMGKITPVTVTGYTGSALAGEPI